MTGGPVNPATRRCDDTITLIDRVLDLVDNPTQRAGDRAYPPRAAACPANRLTPANDATDGVEAPLMFVQHSAAAARTIAADGSYDPGTRAWARAWVARFERRGPRPDPLATYLAREAREDDG